MKLGDLFREAGITQTAAEIPEEHRNWIEEEATPSDPIVALKQRAQEGLFARLGNRLFDASLTQEQLHTFVVRELDAVQDAHALESLAIARGQLRPAVLEGKSAGAGVHDYRQHPAARPAPQGLDGPVQRQARGAVESLGRERQAAAVTGDIRRYPQGNTGAHRDLDEQSGHGPIVGIVWSDHT